MLWENAWKMEPSTMHTPAIGKWKEMMCRAGTPIRSGSRYP